MDINKYAIFENIADTLNFTKSGENMGYTQSGISHVLKTMEDELGFPLFVRSKQGVTLTSNAKMLLPIVRNLLSINEQLEQTIDEINGIETGHITIACFASISRNWLPKIIYNFRKKFPGIEIELFEGGTDEIVDWVSNNKADFGLLSYRHISNLNWIPLYEDPLMAILPKDYPLNGRKTLPIKELIDKPFIISAEGVDYDIHYALDSAHIHPTIPFSSKDDHVIVSMVANKLGYSILPDLVIQGVKHLITAVPIEPYVTRELGIAIKSKEDVSPATTKFILEIQNTLPSIMKETNP